MVTTVLAISSHLKPPDTFFAVVLVLTRPVIAVADQQVQYYLWVVMAALLREPRLAEVVLPVCLEIESRDIVEQNTDNSAQYLPSMVHADILDDLMVTIT